LKKTKKESTKRGIEKSRQNNKRKATSSKKRSKLTKQTKTHEKKKLRKEEPTQENNNSLVVSCKSARSLKNQEANLARGQAFEERHVQLVSSNARKQNGVYEDGERNQILIIDDLVQGRCGQVLRTNAVIQEERKTMPKKKSLDENGNPSDDHDDKDDAEGGKKEDETKTGLKNQDPKIFCVLPKAETSRVAKRIVASLHQEAVGGNEENNNNNTTGGVRCTSDALQLIQSAIESHLIEEIRHADESAQTDTRHKMTGVKAGLAFLASESSCQYRSTDAPSVLGLFSSLPPSSLRPTAKSRIAVSNKV